MWLHWMPLLRRWCKYLQRNDNNNNTFVTFVLVTIRGRRNVHRHYFLSPSNILVVMIFFFFWNRVFELVNLNCGFIIVPPSLRFCFCKRYRACVDGINYRYWVNLRRSPVQPIKRRISVTITISSFLTFVLWRTILVSLLSQAA